MTPEKFQNIIDDAKIRSDDGVVVWLANGLSIVGAYLDFDNKLGFVTISQMPGPQFKVHWRTTRIDVDSVIAVTTPWRQINDNEPLSN